MTHSPLGIRALRIKDVQDKVGVKRATLYDWMNPKSPRYDPSFPRPIRLGKSSIAWLSNTIDDWLLAKYVQQTGISLYPDKNDG